MKISVEKLSDLLTLSTPLDSQKLDVSKESDMKISTEYWIQCSPRVSMYRTNPQTVLNFLVDVYRENFTLNYAENDSVLDLSISPETVTKAAATVRREVRRLSPPFMKRFRILLMWS